MSYCMYCGSVIPDNADKCPVCGKAAEPKEAFANVQNTAEGTENTQDAVSQKPAPEAAAPNQEQRAAAWQSKNEYHSPQANSGNVLLADGEYPIRSYRCAGIFKHKKDAFLTVTNQRIIFQGRDNDDRITQEASVKSVTGVSSYCGRVHSAGRVILAVVLCILSIWSFNGASGYGYYYASYGNGWMVLFGLVLLAFAIAVFCMAFQRRFVLTITSSDAAGSPVSLGAVGRGGGPAVSVVCHTTSETDRMVSELGALIHDVQTMGDEAVVKWKRNY